MIIMKVNVENLFRVFDGDVPPEIFVTLCNFIYLKSDRNDLEVSLKSSSFRFIFEHYFVWGFCCDYFWVKQLNPYTGKPLDQVLLFVDF